MQETPYADINRLLESLLSRMRNIFQDRLAGLYLYGSLTTGDFDPESSDIDLLAATSSDVTGTEIEALRAMHRDFALDNPEWEDRVEVAYLSVTALRTFRSERSPIAVISPGEPFHMKEAGKEWLQSWYAVREDSVALFGPPANTIIGPISLEEFTQCVRNYTVELGERVKSVQKRKTQAYEILTMCRALYLIRTGGRASKRQAALWAQEEMPEWSWLIQSALAWREAWREDKVDHAATRAETVRFVNFVIDQVRA
jgi:predicted nucleotidyltransferase